MPVFHLTRYISFPPPELADENGLLAFGGDLQPQRLITAYRHGIFPWYTENDPILWWFPSPRLVLYPAELKIPRRLSRTMRQNPFRVTCDQAFAEVIAACADTRKLADKGTWITAEMQAAYTELHRLGYAHSVECWQGDLLAGGLYGIRLDQVFFGESMFTKVTDASKIALICLVRQLTTLNIKLIDCQMTTQHLQRFGAREITGSTFQQQLQRLIRTTEPDGNWIYEKVSD
jgi:leucyl/phenylalanyl-tRNA---protein transferase